ncbi:hypothetical protein QR66_19160 [Chromobacterium piscinae]|nr:hypothetical protein QR66_19160 [Chromobacterium piscinae]
MSLKICDLDGRVVVDMGGMDAPMLVEQLSRLEPRDGTPVRKVMALPARCPECGTVLGES